MNDNGNLTNHNAEYFTLCEHDARTLIFVWCHGMSDVMILTKGAGHCEGLIGTKLTSRNSDFNFAILHIYLGIVCLCLTVLKQKNS